MPWGEILKAEEKEISVRYRGREDEEAMRLRKGHSAFQRGGGLRQGFRPVLSQENQGAKQNYIERCVSFFLPDCLEGLKVVFYQYSSVSRRVLPEMLRRLGARVVKEGWSDAFVPVNTEAVKHTDQLSDWVTADKASALVTTDGVGDRPLVVDETG